MKNGYFTRAGRGLLAALFVASLVVGSLVVSCSEAGMSCDFDSNCGGGELCVEGMCANPCTSDQQCGENDSCQVFTRENEADQVHVCMYSPKEVGNNANSSQCLDDAECREMLGSPDAICGLNYRCVVFPSMDASPGMGMFDSVLIRDHTPRELVEEQNHPGAVVSTIFVRDEGGSIVGYGDTLSFKSGMVNSDQTDGHLDGQPVQLDESGQCVAGDNSSMSSLGGEGGYYLVSFVDYRGSRIVLGEGWKIVVIAWSAQCGNEMNFPPESGEYDVSLCVSPSATVDNFETDCQKIGGNVSGYAEFLVTERG